VPPGTWEGSGQGPAYRVGDPCDPLRVQKPRRGLGVRLGVADLAKGLGEGALRGLDREVQPPLVGVGLDPEPLQDAEGQERDRPLPVWGELKNPGAAELRRKRLDPKRPVQREVFFGKKAPGLAGKGGDFLGERAAVKGLGTPLCELLQGLGVGLALPDLPRPGRPAPGKEDPLEGLELGALEL